jgi:hypothetical protein
VRTSVGSGRAHSSLSVRPGVDGKPTKVSNRNSSTRSSFEAESVARLDASHHAGFLFPATRRCASFISPCVPALTKFTTLSFPNCTSTRGLGGRPGKLLNMQELTSTVTHTGIDKIGPRAYARIQKGESSCGRSTTKASSSVPGALVDPGERAPAVMSLTQCQGAPLWHFSGGRFPDHVRRHSVGLPRVREFSAQRFVAHHSPNIFKRTDLHFAKAGLVACGFSLGV